MDLLTHGDTAGLEELAAERPAVVRHLQGRLWDRDGETAERSARALGAVAAAHPDLGKELLRRALWALNDESATNGAPMLPMIGEIGRRAPGLVAPFVGPMTFYLWDDALRPGILAALARIAEAAPELIEDVQDRLRAIDSGDAAPQLAELLAVTREGVDDE